jgi:alkylhydroperoxidase family enzyme
LLGDAKKVQAVLEDLETAPITEAEKALFRFVVKVNRDSPAIGPPDIATVLEAGWTEEAIYDAINVCGLFNFYNRWIDAAGVHEMSEQAHREQAKRMASRGYRF